MAHKREMEHMIKTIKRYDESITDRTLWAIRQVPRHKFVKDYAYADMPFEIGFGQTISQPFIVAYMTNKLNIKPLDKVLEIGTGSGYQAAVLSELTADVYSVERIFKLSQRTQRLLLRLGYGHIQLKVGDGYKGWEEIGPFDKIIVTAMSNEIPLLLVDQLKVGGRMIIPHKGKLELITKTGTKWMCNCGKSKKYPVCDGTHKGGPYKPSVVPMYDTDTLIGVVFVPLIKG